MWYAGPSGIWGRGLHSLLGRLKFQVFVSQVSRFSLTAHLVMLAIFRMQRKLGRLCSYTVPSAQVLQLLSEEKKWVRFFQ